MPPSFPVSHIHPFHCWACLLASHIHPFHCWVCSLVSHIHPFHCWICPQTSLYHPFHCWSLGQKPPSHHPFHCWSLGQKPPFHPFHCWARSWVSFLPFHCWARSWASFPPPWVYAHPSHPGYMCLPAPFVGVPQPGYTGSTADKDHWCTRPSVVNVTFSRGVDGGRPLFSEG